MYASYFGLVEPPFSIAPDPRYLYLSTGHREALAHLLWGLSAGGGFVQLTGEVGTGKTTLCRALLEQLPPEVDVAMVFNPALTSVELVATVCDELHIAYPAGTTSLKTLVDALDRHLLDAHARGRRTVLVIDEAQDLSREVLEQIRLLTNLETTRDKLLQIILIGQPELRQVLAREDLRQLAQRVTARYHLRPFTEAETLAYVNHRLQVAGQRRTIFRRRALRLLHRLARGIPRLINTIADRALLGAYSSGREQVDAATVRRAAAEVLGPVARARRWLPAATAAVLVALVGAGAMVAATRPSFLAVRPVAMTRAAPASADAEPAPPQAPVPEPPRPTLADLLGAAPADNDKGAAFQALYARWGVDYRMKSGELACDRAREVGLRCLFRAGTWNVVRRLDLPAILTLDAPAGDRRYAVVTGLGDDTATLEAGGRALKLSLREIEGAWDGTFIALWQPPTSIASILAPGARGKGVTWLRQRLTEVEGEPAGTSDLYDEALKRRVMGFQRAHQLTPDGIAGEETLVRLATLARDASAPSLSERTR